MRHQATRRKKGPITRQAELKTFALIVSIAAIPFVGTVWVFSATSQPDLSDLVPIRATLKTYALLNWSTLLRERPHTLNAGSSISAGSQICALGYMVEGDRPIRDGTWIGDFVLLPEAGNLMHAAHRFGDQMIAVHLREETRVRFSARKLVWVRGTFKAFPGDAGGSTPLYALEQASVEAADKKQIASYFR